MNGTGNVLPVFLNDSMIGLDDARRIAAGDYTYLLPQNRIAAYPLPERDRSKLLVIDENGLKEDVFSRLPQYLADNSLLVLNNTRVVQARLLFHKPGGALIEVFCLHPISPYSDVQLAFETGSPTEWFCLVGGAKKWKNGKLTLALPHGGGLLHAEKLDRMAEGYRIRFVWEPSGIPFSEVLLHAGITPLPPYIQRPSEESDKQRYQTVFAKTPGSVAAPTAGLHFTPEVFSRLGEKGIDVCNVTLHVGAGTFKPVTAARIGDHAMHSEQFFVSTETLKSLKKSGRLLVSVGTTSMRTLESLYWLGVKLLGEGISEEVPFLEQWFPYAYTGPLPGVVEALDALIHKSESNGLGGIRGETSLIIVPGYDFKITERLITNFHQPGSTLLLLVAAFAGEQWVKAYRYALDHDFRFLSYGDSCLFTRQNLQS